MSLGTSKANKNDGGAETSGNYYSNPVSLIPPPAPPIHTELNPTDKNSSNHNTQCGEGALFPPEITS